MVYYSNSVASYQLLLIAGDVHPEPGPYTGKKPRAKHIAVKCPQCEKTVKRSHKRAACDKCFNVLRIRCVYSNSWFIKNTGTHDPRSWKCPECTLTELPFLILKDFGELEGKANEQTSSALDSELEMLDSVAEALRTHPTHLSIMHLNTKSIVSPFNEFQSLVGDYPMDIITMSETWLKDDPALLDYVSLSGYTTIFN